MNRTKIEYVDYTWNPVTGCLRGCSYCYARKIANRFRGKIGYVGTDPFKPTFHPERLIEPQKVKKRSRILVCSMGDLFAEWVPLSWTCQVIDASKSAPQHDYLFLTKSPKRYWEYQNKFGMNHWIGTTVCRGEMLGNIERIQHLEGPAIKFASFEPLLGRVDLYRYFLERGPGIDWIIIGAQTNPEKQPKEEWVDIIVEAAEYYDIPVFMKNNLDWTHKIQEIPKLGLK